MPVSVVVPRAGDCPHRDRAWEWVRKQYEGLEVVEGWGDPDEWCKATAVEEALKLSTGDVLVVADADVYSEHLAVAIDAVSTGAHEWASPHRHIRRLTEEGTRRFIEGERETAPVEENHHAVLGGGIVVLTRETYERVPLDRRFAGWGGEDHAWAAALRTLAGEPFIAPQPLWHLWHPPQQRMSRKVGNVANDELRGRYIGAKFSPRQMRELIEEGRCLSNGSSQLR